MGQAIWRIRRRNNAKRRLAQIADNAAHTIVIHYSCESFYDRPDGSSPRITSIAVLHLDTRQTSSFSIHQVAERKRLAYDEVERHYDELERLMLDDFYGFVGQHSRHTWIHWNMRDINYGFPAIAHRYRVLGGEPTVIPETSLFDLAHALIDMYGSSYIGHPRLERLVRKNEITDKDFLNGAEEAAAFERREYVKLHQSTLRKVDVIAGILERTVMATLKTNARWNEIYGSYPEAVAEWLTQSWPGRILAFLATIATLGSCAWLFLPK